MQPIAEFKGMIVDPRNLFAMQFEDPVHPSSGKLHFILGGVRLTENGNQIGVIPTDDARCACVLLEPKSWSNNLRAIAPSQRQAPYHFAPGGFDMFQIFKLPGTQVLVSEIRSFPGQLILVDQAVKAAVIPYTESFVSRKLLGFGVTGEIVPDIARLLVSVLK